MLLSGQACVAPYWASRVVTDVYRPLLAELGLTSPQSLVLVVLRESEARTVGDVGGASAVGDGTPRGCSSGSTSPGSSSGAGSSATSGPWRCTAPRRVARFAGAPGTCPARSAAGPVPTTG